MRRLSVYLRLGAAVLLYGTALPASRIVTHEMPILVGTGIRMSVAALAFVPFLWSQRHELQQLSRRDVLVVTGIALSAVLITVLMLCGTRFVPCTVICALTCATPMATALGAMLFLRDRPNWRQLSWIGLAAAVSVAAKVSCGGHAWRPASLTALALGVTFGLLAVCCEAAYTLLAKTTSGRISPLVLAALSTILAAMLVIPMAGIEAASFDWSTVSLRGYMAAAWWGGGALAAGTWLWYSGVQFTTGSTAAAFLAALPFCTLWLSQLWLGAGH